ETTGAGGPAPPQTATPPAGPKAPAVDEAVVDERPDLPRDGFRVQRERLLAIQRVDHQLLDPAQEKSVDGGAPPRTQQAVLARLLDVAREDLCDVIADAAERIVCELVASPGRTDDETPGIGVRRDDL